MNNLVLSQESNERVCVQVYLVYTGAGGAAER